MKAKRVLSFILSAMMVASMSSMAFAETGEDGGEAMWIDPSTAQYYYKDEDGVLRLADPTGNDADRSFKPGDVIYVSLGWDKSEGTSTLKKYDAYMDWTLGDKYVDKSGIKVEYRKSYGPDTAASGFTYAVNFGGTTYYINSSTQLNFTNDLADAIKAVKDQISSGDWKVLVDAKTPTELSAIIASKKQTGTYYGYDGTNQLWTTDTAALADWKSHNPTTDMVKKYKVGTTYYEQNDLNSAMNAAKLAYTDSSGYKKDGLYVATLPTALKATTAGMWVGTDNNVYTDKDIWMTSLAGGEYTVVGAGSTITELYDLPSGVGLKTTAEVSTAKQGEDSYKFSVGGSDVTLTEAQITGGRRTDGYVKVESNNSLSDYKATATGNVVASGSYFDSDNGNKYYESLADAGYTSVVSESCYNIDTNKYFETVTSPNSGITEENVPKYSDPELISRNIKTVSTAFSLSDGKLGTEVAAKADTSYNTLAKTNAEAKVTAELEAAVKAAKKVSGASTYSVTPGTMSTAYRYFVAIPTKKSDTTRDLDVVGTLGVGKTSSSAKKYDRFNVEVTLTNGKYDDGAKVDGDIEIDSPDSPAVVKFDKDADEITITWGNDELARFEVNARGQGDLNLRYSTKYDADFADQYPNANIDFLNFVASPTFNRTGTLYIYADEDSYIYEVTADGAKKINSAKYDRDEEAWVIRTRKLGSYAISDKKLKTVDQMESSSSSKPTSEPSDSSNNNNNNNSNNNSGNNNGGGSGNKYNPDTGR